MKMINRPLKKDRVRMMVKNLQPIDYEKMFASPIFTFVQLYDTGLKVKDAIESGVLDKFIGRVAQSRGNNINTGGSNKTVANTSTGNTIGNVAIKEVHVID